MASSLSYIDKMVPHREGFFGSYHGPIECFHLDDKSN
jgi:hypothetical protein